MVYNSPEAVVCGRKVIVHGLGTMSAAPSVLIPVVALDSRPYGRSTGLRLSMSAEGAIQSRFERFTIHVSGFAGGF